MQDRSAATILNNGAHICALLPSQTATYHVLVPIIKDGLDRGYRAHHMISRALFGAHDLALEDGGIDTAAAQQRGLLDVEAWDESYTLDGYFDANRMLQHIASILSVDDHQPPTRILGDMGWILEDVPGTSDILEYEAHLNELQTRPDDMIICKYDVSLFSNTFILDVMRTHPLVVLDGAIRPNPLYVAPQEFLRDMAARARRDQRARH
jgi:hypothetical protein